MPPIVCIVGASNSGNTTFLEKLIPELVRRGYRIGTIKHDAHGFEMDREGKDTWRHRQAGAQTIAIVSPNQTATIRRTDAELDLEEAVGRFDEQIATLCGPFEDAITRLDTIPGVARQTAEIIVAEIGIDMSRFPSAAHLAAWAVSPPVTTRAPANVARARPAKGIAPWASP